MFFWGLAVGVFIGFFMGCFVLALFAISREEDKAGKTGAARISPG